MPRIIIKCEGCGLRFEHITPVVIGVKKKYCMDCLRKRDNSYNRRKISNGKEAI